MTLFASRRAIAFMIAGALVAIASLPINQQTAHAEPDNPGSTSTVYVPLINQKHWPDNPFGFETHRMSESVLHDRARALNVGWVRLNSVSWWSVQPNQGDAYNWSALATFESEVLAGNKLGLTPIVTINRSPRWATMFPDACSPIRGDRFADFANFMEALVARYSKPPYNVKYWELFNEVDAEFADVPLKDHVIGCWGDRNVKYFGGMHYGNMLKAVTPAIKRADPASKVLAGAFILIRPNTQWPYIGKPEEFLSGMLEVGAAPYFDILSFHSHGWYWFSPVQDNGPNDDWTLYGSTVDAKANFFKQILNRYGVTKPMFMDESAFICPDITEEYRAKCSNPPAEFFDEQANHVVRGYTASLAAGVNMIAWYTLDEQGWGNSGLLDTQLNPRPVYRAYQALINQVNGAQLPPVAVDYGEGVRAWRFNLGSHFVDVVYASFVGAKNIAWPASSHIAMYNRFGEALLPGFSGGNATYAVTTQPIFIHRKP